MADLNSMFRSEATDTLKAMKNLSRRELLRFGLTGFSSLTLGQLLAAREHGADKNGSAAKTAIILIWLRGGQSHLDTLDPKPLAPVDFRGPFRPIRTNVPGVEVSELLPRLAKIADKYTIVRSLAHTGGGHPAGSLQVLSGDTDPQDKLKPILPDWMSVANYLRRDPRKSIPNYVAVNPVDRYDNFTIAGSTYLGHSHDAFKITGDPNLPSFNVPNIGVRELGVLQRIQNRREIKLQIDNLNRALDASHETAALDEIEQKAFNLLTSEKARSAFEVNKEPDSVRDRYGRNRWGQQCLLARRLVEAGVEIVTTEFDGPLCGRVANWDDHAVNHHVFNALQHRSPFYDQAVSALVEDIYQRGLDQRVMVVVTGEFGRTPRISHVASSGGGVASGSKGTVQPGRDHWPRAGSMIIAGGGVRTGQVIGATDAKGEDVIEDRMRPSDFLATIYLHLGIDFKNTSIENFSGRPVPIVQDGEPLAGLW